MNPYVLNADPRLTRRWGAALDRVLLGLGDAILAVGADSTGAGQGGGGEDASGDGGIRNARASSWPTVIARHYEAAGVPTNTDSVWGSANYATSRGYDARLTFGAGWSAADLGALPYLASLGGPPFINTTTTNPLAFQPTKPFDRITVRVARQTGGADYIVKLAGGAALAPISGGGPALSAAGADVQTLTFAVAKETTPPAVQVQRTAGGELVVIGVEAWDSAISRLRIWNMGWAGSTVANWSGASKPWSPANLLAALPTDGTIFDLLINDALSSASLPTVRASYGDRIAAAETTGDAFVMTPPPSILTSVTGMAQQQYAQVARQAARDNGAVIIDYHRLAGSYAEQAAAGKMYDGLHPNARGYADMARLAFAALRG